tara:strand:+ start:216 stop:647 length:432 start_codon:yes stop_codon:yes gene_type:complete
MRHIALLVHAVRSGFVQYFNFRGRSTRSEFWYFMLGWILLYLIVAVIDQAALGPVLNLSDLPFYEFIPYSYVDQQVGWLTFLYRPLTAIPTIAVTVRRLHDAGKSGWYSALWILPLPVIGWFWLFPLLMKPGLEGDERVVPSH